MNSVVVYESMFGATRAVADAVSEGLARAGACRVIRASDADQDALRGADLVIVGAPTHAHSLPRPSTRRGAPNYVGKSGGDLGLEPGADVRPGVREWLAAQGTITCRAAAFDTRAGGPAWITGSASKPIVRTLRSKGAELVQPPLSCRTVRHKLAPGELERAREWGEQLADAVVEAHACR
jgi:flavodoxin